MAWRRRHGLILPEKEEWLLFKSGAHAIYDNFPEGNLVHPEECWVDFEKHIVVEKHGRHSLDRWHRGKKKWVVSNYVAVQFKSACGARLLWTNFSRDGVQWMWTSREMRIWLGEE